MFVDRHDQIRLIGDHLSRLAADPGHFGVVEVVGIGGVGKSRLLEHLRDLAMADGRPAQLIWVSFDAGVRPTTVPALMAMRNQVEFPCHLFDTAMLSYWSAAGLAPAVPPGNRMSSSLAFTVQATAGALSLPLPINFGVEVYRAARSAVERRLRYEQHEFEAIDRLRMHPERLRGELPRMLARDFSIGLNRSAGPLVIFFDGYERQDREVLRNRSRWMREFIENIGVGLHVIATRYPFDWDGRSQVPFELVRVDELPEAEAGELVRARLGEIPEDHLQLILAASHRVPFFVEAAIECYQRLAERGADIEIDAFPEDQAQTLATLIGHLPDGHRPLALALSSVQIFDQALFEHVVRDLNVPVALTEFQDFVSWFAVREVEPGLFHVHDLLAKFVRRSANLSAAERVRSLSGITLHLAARIEAEGAGLTTRTAAILHGVFSGWASVPEDSDIEIELLVDIAYALYDVGYWDELPTPASLADVGVLPPSEEHPVRVVAELFASLHTRRTRGTAPAIEMLDKLEDRAPALGGRESAVRFEIAYLSEISGNYAKARVEFAQLDEQSTPFDPRQRDHVRARLYHADCLIMDGRFVTGARLLLEAAGSMEQGSQDLVEMLRHRGHAYRFSALPERAAAIYREALSAASNSLALNAKLRTNLAEAYCWYDPIDALEEASIAGALNQRLGSRIELAKCAAARAIAHGRMGSILSARAAVNEAREWAQSASYPAGVAFALQAGAVAEGLAGSPSRARGLRAELVEVLGVLDTYAHLDVITGWNDAPRDLGGFEWIEPTGLSDRISRLAHR